MKNVHYPKLDGATDINGFVGPDGQLYNIYVGKTITVPEQVATRLKEIYSFLEVVNPRATGLAKAVAKVEEEVKEAIVEVKPDQDAKEIEGGEVVEVIEDMDYRELQSEAKRLNIKSNQKEGALREQVKERLMKLKRL